MKNSTVYNYQYLELKEKLRKLQIERKEFLESKSLSIKKLMSRDNMADKENNDHNKLIEDLKEIDREVEGLEHIITTSINIAISIIQPVRDREKSIVNITKTVDLLNVENEIKDLLKKIKSEKSNIEKKN